MKIAFCQMYVSPCGNFGPNERSVWAVLIGFGLICRSAWRGIWKGRIVFRLSFSTWLIDGYLIVIDICVRRASAKQRHSAPAASLQTCSWRRQRSCD